MILNMLFHSFYVKSTQNSHLFYFGIYNDTHWARAHINGRKCMCACLDTEIGRKKNSAGFFIFIYPFIFFLECLIAKQQYFRNAMIPTHME